MRPLAETISDFLHVLIKLAIHNVSLGILYKSNCFVCGHLTVPLTYYPIPNMQENLRNHKSLINTKLFKIIKKIESFPRRLLVGNLTTVDI